jgi:hypothetical protein
MEQYAHTWNRQFSYDEEGLQLMYLLFFLAYFAGLGVQLYATYQYMRASSLHPVSIIMM